MNSTPDPGYPELHGVRRALEMMRDAVAEERGMIGFAPMSVELEDGIHDAIDTILRSRRLVVTGPPGSGKTTLLKEVKSRIVSATLAAFDGFSPPTLPLYVDLATARSGDGIDDLLVRAMARDGIPEGAAPTIILLDRAERVTDEYLLDGLTLILQAGGVSSAAVIVACREAEWEICRRWLESTPRAELMPIADEVVHDSLARELPREVAAAAAEWLARDEELARAVRSPLALGALIACARRDAPSRWRRVIVLEALFEKILDGVPSVERTAHRAALADVAFSSRGRALADQVDTLAMGLGVTRDAMIESGAVVGRGATLKFVEPLLAEHCAAAALAFRFHDDPRQLAERLAPLDGGESHRAEWLASVYHLTDDPLRFLAAMMTLEDGPELVAFCLAAPDAADPDGPAGAAALVSRLVEPVKGADRAQIDVDALEALRDALIERSEFSAAAVAAAAAAERRALDAGRQAVPVDEEALDRYRDLLSLGRDLRVSDLAGAEAVLRQASALATRLESDTGFERGNAAEDAGDFQAALAHYSAALEQSPDAPDYLAAMGRTLLALGEYAQAIEPLERARSLNPESARVTADLGTALREVGRLEAATALLADAAALAPHRPEYEMAAGEALAEIGRLDAAEAAMSRAAAMRPDRGQWHDALGQIRLELGRAQAAAESFERAFTLAPDDVSLMRRLARALAAAGEPARAVDLLSRAVGMAGDDAGLLGDLGRALARAGDIAAAIDALRAAVAIDDIWPADHVLLARLMREAALQSGDIGSLADALTYAERAAELAPSSALARDEWTAARSAAGVPDALEAGANSAPTDTGADHSQREADAMTLGQLATLYEESGDIQAAYRTLVRAAERSPSDSAIARHAGEIARRLGRPGDAAAHFSVATALTPDDPELLRALAAAHAEAGGAEQAFDALRRLADLEPMDGEALIALARSARGLGRLDDEHSAIQAARSVLPENAEVDALEGEFALAVGDEAAARAAFERAVKHAPDVAEHAIRLSDLYAAASPERALEILAGAPDDGRVHERRATLLAAGEEWTAAAAAYRAALAAGVDSPEIAAALGTALLRDGRPEEAVELLQNRTSAWQARGQSEVPEVIFPPLAEACEQTGRLRDALVAWNSADDSSLSIEQRLRHSRLASKLGAFEESVIAAQRAAAQRPELAAPRVALADAYAARGLLESAVRAAQAAAVLEPLEPVHRLRLAGFERSLGRSDAAIATLSRAATDHPESAEINLVLGRLLHEAGNVYDARKHLSMAADRSPDDPAVLRAMADTFSEDEPRRAAELLSRAVLRAPGDPGLRAKLARVLWAAGDVDAAAREWDRTAGLCDAAGPEAAEDAAEAWRELSRCRLALEDLEGARAALSAARVRSNTKFDPDILRLASELSARSEDWVGALDALEQAVALRPHDAELQRELGLLRLSRGDFEGGVVALETALGMEPRDERALLALGREHNRAGRHAKAAEIFEILTELDPADAQTLIDLGRCRLATGAPAGASAALRRAAEFEPENAMIRWLLSEAEAAAGRADVALQEAEIAVALAPESPEAQRALAGARRAHGDSEGALNELERAAKLSPDDPITFMAMAAVADDVGDMEAVRDALHRAVALQPGHAKTAVRYAELIAAEGWDVAYVTPRALMPIDEDSATVVVRSLTPLIQREGGPLVERAARALSTVLARRGDLEAAEEVLKVASEGGPDDPTAAVFDVESLLQRAWLRLLLADAEGALAAAKLALAHGVDDARVHGLIGMAHAAEGEPLAASRAFQTALQRAPDDAGMGLMLAAALKAAGRDDEAVAALENARAAGGGSQAEVAIGEIALQHGNADGAIEAFERGIAADKRNADTWRLLATARAEAADLTGAIQALERATHLAPERADWQAALGEAHLRIGQAEEARARFARAIVLDPYNVDYRCGDAEAALALGFEVEARTTLADALRAEPGHAKARAILGRLEFDSGRPDLARDEFAAAVAGSPDDASFHRSLGLAARGAGDDEGALGALERSAVLDTGEASTYMALGELHESRRETDDAIQAYQQALANAPDSAEVHLRLGRLCGGSGMIEKALAHLSMAASLAPEDARPLVETGRALVAAEAFDLALDAFDEALGRDQVADRSEVYLEAGQAAMRVNDYSRAKAYLELANVSASSGRTRRLLAEVNALRFIGRIVPQRAGAGAGVGMRGEDFGR